jgi:putative DNA primase/helicase
VLGVDIGDGLYLAGIDLDTCVKDEVFEPWAADVIRKFGSYTEISPSGNGAKVFFVINEVERDVWLTRLRRRTGDPAQEGEKWALQTGNNHPPAIELYLGKRYFTVTGEIGPLARITTFELDWLVAHGSHFASKDGKKGGDKSRSATAWDIAKQAHIDGKTFEEFCELVKNDPITGSWYTEKGLKHNKRELTRAWERTAVPDDPPWTISLKFPVATARLLVLTQFTDEAGRRKVHRHRGTTFSWDGIAYREFLEDELEARIYRFLDDCVTLNRKNESIPVGANKPMVTYISHALYAETLLPGSVPAPMWLEEREQAVEDLFVFSNGMLHLPSMCFLPPTPTFFCHNTVDYEYDPAAQCPRWMQFLGEIFKNDQQSIDALQDIFGYLLTCDTSLQKAFMFYGRRRCGKGTVARLLAKLLGEYQVGSQKLDDFAKSFGVQSLIGKTLAIMTDARLTNSHMAAVEALLTITGEDKQKVNVKYKGDWEGYLRSRVLLMTNELPALRDTSMALVSRFIIVVFANSFLGREDTELDAKLTNELPGIFNWSVVGWDRIRARRHFIEPTVSASIRKTFTNLSSPMNQFIEEECVLGANKYIVPLALYRSYGHWCDKNGRTVPNMQTFARDLLGTTDIRNDKAPRKKDEKRPRVYWGIDLRDDLPVQDFDDYEDDGLPFDR